VNKLKLATHKYGEMMESYKVKEELENWLAKLGELKVRVPCKVSYQLSRSCERSSPWR
jgi:hypothetical protein